MSKTESKTIIKSSVFKVGDYIVAPDCVYLRIMAVVDSGMGPMYGVLGPKDAVLHWQSQYQLDSDKMVVGQPPLEQLKSLKAGDIIRAGQRDEANYVTVLARVGDAVLLSSRPNKRLAQKLIQLDKMFSEVSEDTGMNLTDLIDEREMTALKKLGSSLHAAKIADEWLAIETIALMNWELVSE